MNCLKSWNKKRKIGPDFERNAFSNYVKSKSFLLNRVLELVACFLLGKEMHPFMTCIPFSFLDLKWH
jgi:hypothetical protein